MLTFVKLGEPPDADPHVRWCERTGASRPLLLDLERVSFSMYVLDAVEAAIRCYNCLALVEVNEDGYFVCPVCGDTWKE
jgi:hypothetical protein